MLAHKLYLSRFFLNQVFQDLKDEHFLQIRINLFIWHSSVLTVKHWLW